MFLSGLSQISTGRARLSKGAWACVSAVALALVAVVAAVLTLVAPVSAEESVDLTAVVDITTPAEELGVVTETGPVVTEPVTVTTVSAGPSVDYSAMEIEFVQLVNEYRKDNGLEPLLLSDVITVACDRHSSDMATYGFMDHLTGYRDTANGGLVPMKGKSSDYFTTGTNPAERMIACGYDFATMMGENLAAGYDSALGALEGFKASPTHNEILLSDDFRVMGISLVYESDSDFGYYWTTDFGGVVDSSAHVAITAVVSVD